jgi:hypothetical protein
MRACSFKVKERTSLRNGFVAETSLPDNARGAGSKGLAELQQRVTTFVSCSRYGAQLALVSEHAAQHWRDGVSANSTEQRAKPLNVGHEQRLVPKAGDVLMSRPTARADLYYISFVPANAHMTARRYTEAIDTVRTLARRWRVDGWFTSNQTDYVLVAGYRSQAEQLPRERPTLKRRGHSF